MTIGPNIDEILVLLEKIVPLSQAAEWDNVGLLIGDRQWHAIKFLTCLTITNEVAEEAIRKSCDLILSHHPLPFRPFKTLTADSGEAERLCLKLAASRIAVISPHTAFDNAPGGIQEMIAHGVDLKELRPLKVSAAQTAIGRVGRFSPPITVTELCERLCVLMSQKFFVVSGDPLHSVATAAITCGSAGDLLPEVIRSKAEVWVVGELSYHRVLEAKANKIQVITTGHHASESFAIHRLGQRLSQADSRLIHMPSQQEKDPWTLLNF
jgi:dinuclear metal center YbgI/SA1388 family protein